MRQQQRLESCGIGLMDVRERGLRFTLATISSEWVNGALEPIMAENEGSPFYPEARLPKERGLLCHVKKQLRTNIRYKAV
jgi:hypothetical protein